MHLILGSYGLTFFSRISRFPIPDSLLPIPDSLLPFNLTYTEQSTLFS
ncbi:hypothetical protein [Moorena producens]